MLSNLKIGKRLIISFIIVEILAGLSGIVSVFEMAEMNKKHEYALVNYGFSQGNIGKAMLMVANVNRCVRDIICFTDQQDIASAKSQTEESWAQYEILSAAVEETLSDSEELAQYETIKRDLQSYTAKCAEISVLGDTTDIQQSLQAQRMAVDELDPLYNTLYDDWTDLMELNIKVGNELSDHLSLREIYNRIFTLTLTAISFGIGLLLAVKISQGISRPIAACVARLEQLEKGDLDTPVPESTSQDETGTLLRALEGSIHTLAAIVKDINQMLNAMAEGNFDVHTQAERNYVGAFSKVLYSIRGMNQRISDTLQQINLSANQVDAGAEQVSAGAQAQAQGAAEQASSVEELAASISEIDTHIQQSSTNARTGQQIAIETSERIVACNQQMDHLIAAMGEIQDSSNEIEKIISTIESIAFQTNILALNAAVEAARAGTAGKGFAVVADEVRNLATKSAEASKNTAALIERSIQAVENGTKLAGQTAKALLSSVEDVRQAAEVIDQIYKASETEAVSIAQINQGIEQISSVVQTNSATSEESAAASEELSGQAQVLKQLVSKFKLRRNSQTADISQEADR